MTSDANNDRSFNQSVIEKDLYAAEFLDLVDQEGDIHKALNHLNANMIFDYSKLDQNDMNLCDDCFCPVPKKDEIPYFSFCTNTKNFSSYGIGVYLYFFYIKFLLFSLILLAGIVAIPQIYFSSNYFDDLKNFCDTTKFESYNNSTISECISFKNKTNDFLGKMSYYNIESYDKIVSIRNLTEFTSIIDMNLIHFLAQIFLTWISFIGLLICYNLYLEADLLNITPEDFTLMLSNLPTDEVKLDEALKTLDAAPVYEVNRTYKLTEFFKLKEEFKNKRKILQQMIRNKSTKISSCFQTYYKADIISNLKKLDNEMQDLIDKINDNSMNDEFVTDCCFLIFKDTLEYEAFQNQFPKTFISYLWNLFKYTISIIFCRCFFRPGDRRKYKEQILYTCEIAPEPTDVIWENMQYSNLNRFFRKIIIYFLAILVLFGSFWALFYISKSQKNLSEDSAAVKYIVSILFSLSITIINVILNIVLEILTKQEKNRSYSSYYLSYSLKLMTAWFVNTAILPVIVTYFGNEWSNKDVLIQNSFIFFLTNAFVSPILYFFDMSYYMKLIKRYLLKKKYIKNKEPMEHTQGELNQIFENPDMNLALKYAYLGKTIFMTVFYIPLLPVGILISFCGLLLFYIIEKYNTTKFYKKPPSIQAEISLIYLKLFKLVIFLNAIGVYVFQSNMYENYFNFDLLSIIMFGVLVLIPLSEIFIRDFIQVSTNDKYEEEYFNFTTNYDTQNPMTKRNALVKILNKLFEKGIITHEEHSFYAERLSKGEILDLIELYKDKTGAKKKIGSENKGIQINKMIKQMKIGNAFNFNIKEKMSKELKDRNDKGEQINRMFIKAIETGNIKVNNQALRDNKKIQSNDYISNHLNNLNSNKADNKNSGGSDLLLINREIEENKQNNYMYD